ncbi:unnamed protein product [Acanthoscelides obtectus]|uniref:PiggyBac transposable element-derived protein domain-containing protein n=1 Tax=Acanthoscelides obtectus TaxID=200917 RepID=A0A9P0LLU6_ACAOB|nr:unnamed protein product [Acanthoscelides obtectus]CAK1684769.1 PiggyBac transposable element-derived protein 4 [Acanthoscelides obtectus]
MPRCKRNLVSEMSWEAEQKRLQALCDEVQLEEDLDDEDLELAADEDVTETRDTDSESDQEYNDEVISLQTAEIPGAHHFLGKDNKARWRKHCTKKTSRTRQENIIVRLPGVRDYGKHARSEIECWSLFFSDKMLEEIVEKTNLYITRISENYSRDRAAKLTDLLEIKALFGLLYLAGTLKSSKLNTKEIWNRQGTGIERFWVTMSEQRFRFLLTCLRFDDLSTRDERKKFDKLAPIRSTFDKFVKNCKNTYCIGANATIDEKLEAFRGRCGFKQYIPSKPNKYGVKIFALVDASTSYCANLEVYVGTQPDGPFKTNNDPVSIVLRLIEPVSGTNRNLTCDNWFTSVPLVEKLLKEHRLTFVGTSHGIHKYQKSSCLYIHVWVPERYDNCVLCPQKV